jgi:transposase
VLVELKAVEQRYRAVIDVLDGMSVTEVAQRNKVSRQSVHTWLRRYANGGMAALADKSSKPESCPHQMASLTEARVISLRREHPRWGPRSIRTRLANEGFAPVPGLSSIYRTLVRHHLLEPTQRKRARSDYKRWERSRSMELWQMDVVGRFHLADGTEVKVVTGVDDHSRFCVCARVVARGHGPAGVRGTPVRTADPWRARPDPDRQRQGLHRSLRPRPWTSALRPHLCQQRHPPSPHRSVFADHDGQGRALPPDHQKGLLGRPRSGARHN